MATLTFHGHATCTVTTDDGTRLVIDPFFGDNPATELSVEEVDADFVLVTHGHYDHIADAAALAKRTGATVISTVEVVEFLATQGVENLHGMNIGGARDFPFGRLKMVHAIHGGSVQLEGGAPYTTPCAGFVIQVDGCRLYHAGDTALTLDMQLLKGAVDVALLPIGDNFTMGPEDAARAVEFIEPDRVIPIHYDTWPVIEQDPEAFRELVGDRASVEVLAPGGETTLG
ncbi:MAG: metal-dependent hydrolase [Gemmatimonadales bacterium]|jgi:L-ascorbate metabolism protein UlaG (beta-lactamase superfamily)|nr:MAG: metal-dependent hydrolase [Gemmatimonadales bacterium]